MNVYQTPFKTGWYSVDLGEYRKCEGTYCPYESLPPVDMGLFRSKFQWLSPLDDQLEEEMFPYRTPEEDRRRMASNLNRLVFSARQINLELQEPFITFMGAPDLQDRIPTCTACYFDLSDHIIKSPIGDNLYLIRFLNDQQGVLFWYLCLNAYGQHCVIGSPIWFDSSDDEVEKAISVESMRIHTLFCAPTFESFLYRYWLENHIWFALAGEDLTGKNPKSLTEEQQNYVNFYKTQ